MYRALFSLVVAISLTGCIFPVSQTVSKTDFICSVRDAVSDVPIENAAVLLIYRDSTGEEVKRGPFYSDSSGVARINVENDKLWVWRPGGFFGGGFLRYVTVTAQGYEQQGTGEGFDIGAFNSGLEFELLRVGVEDAGT